MLAMRARDGAVLALEGHVVVASDEEVHALHAHPHVFYLGIAENGQRREVALAPGSSVILRELDAMHWLVSGELPGETGPTHPLAFLRRGGVSIDVPTQYVLEDGRRWECNSARYFSPDECRESLVAVRSLDQDGLKRKGGELSLNEWQKICGLLGSEDQTTRFVVAGNVCMRLPVDNLPIFNPPLASREKERSQHAKGSLPAVMRSGGIALAGDDFLGFGAGPARAFLAGALAALDMTGASPAVEKCWRAARAQGKAMIVYSRLSKRELYDSALHWLRLGYFDAEEIVDQLGEEFDDPPEALARAVTATNAILALDRSRWPAITDCDRLFAALDRLREEGFLVLEYAGFLVDHAYGLVEQSLKEGGVDVRSFCFFHQQCILRACEGGGLDVYFGEARRSGNGVEMNVSSAVGERIVKVMAEHGLAAEWDGRGETPIEIRMVWKCRPRRERRAQP
jgi:hypothetical protein